MPPLPPYIDIRSSDTSFMTCLDSTEVPQKFVIVTFGQNFWDMRGHPAYHSAQTHTFLPDPNGSPKWRSRVSSCILFVPSQADQLATSGADPGFFLGAGGGGGVHTPCTLPRDPPLDMSFLLSRNLYMQVDPELQRWELLLLLLLLVIIIIITIIILFIIIVVIIVRRHHHVLYSELPLNGHLSDGQPTLLKPSLNGPLSSEKYIRTEMYMPYMTVICKMLVILLCCSSLQCIYVYAFRPWSRES